MNTLTLSDVIGIVRDMATQTGTGLGVDRARISGALRAAETIADREGHSRPPAWLYGVSMATVFGLVGIRSLGSPMDEELALQALSRLATINGYSLHHSSRDKDQLIKHLRKVERDRVPSDDLIEKVKRWVLSHIFEDSTFEPLSSLPSETLTRPDVIRGFIACPITGQDATAIGMYRSVSALVRTVLSDYEIYSYPVVEYVDPLVAPDFANAPIMRTIDEGQIARSDLVIIILDGGATGLGVVASLAERYLARLLVVCLDGLVTPMLTGMQTPPPIINRTETLENDLRTFVIDCREDLAFRSRHRGLRMERARMRRDALRVRLPTLTDEELTREYETILSRERFLQLLSDPGYLLGATLGELDEIEAVLGKSTWPDLSTNEYRSLFKAEHTYGWGPDRSETLAWQARARKASVVSRRMIFTDAQTWKRLNDELS